MASCLEIVRYARARKKYGIGLLMLVMACVGKILD